MRFVCQYTIFCKDFSLFVPACYYYERYLVRSNVKYICCGPERIIILIHRPRSKFSSHNLDQHSETSGNIGVPYFMTLDLFYIFFLLLKTISTI